jgi:hypothetical protein
VPAELTVMSGGAQYAGTVGRFESSLFQDPCFEVIRARPVKPSRNDVAA